MAARKPQFAPAWHLSRALVPYSVASPREATKPCNWPHQLSQGAFCGVLCTARKSVVRHAWSDVQRTLCLDNEDAVPGRLGGDLAAINSVGDGVEPGIAANAKVHTRHVVAAS